MVDTFAWPVIAVWGEDITKLDFVNDKYMVRGKFQKRNQVVTSYDIVEPGSGWNMGAISEVSSFDNSLKNKRAVPTHRSPGALNEFSRLDYTMVIEWDEFDITSSTQDYAFYELTPPATRSDTDFSGYGAPSNGPTIPTLLRGFFYQNTGPENDYASITTNAFEVNIASEWREVSMTITYDQVDYDYWFTGYPGRFQKGSGEYYLCPLGGTYGWKGIPYEMLPDLMSYQHNNFFCTSFDPYLGWGVESAGEPDPNTHPPDCRRFVPTTLYGREDVPNPYADAGYNLPDGNEAAMFFGGASTYGYYVRRANYHYLGFDVGPYAFGKGHDPFRIGLFSQFTYFDIQGVRTTVALPSVGDYYPGAGIPLGATDWVPTDFDPLYIGGRAKNLLNVFSPESGAIDGGTFWGDIPWTDCPFGPSSRDPTRLRWRVRRSTPGVIVPMTFAKLEYPNSNESVYTSLRLFPNSKKTYLPKIEDDDGNFLPDIDILEGGFSINKNGRNRMAITVSGKYMAVAINGSNPTVLEAPAGFSMPRPRDAVGEDEYGNEVKYYSPFTDEAGKGHIFQFPYWARKIRCIWLYRKKKPIKALKKLSTVRDLVSGKSPYWKIR